MASIVLAVLVLSAGMWGLWQPGVRIEHVSVTGGDSSLAAVAQGVLRGTYGHVLPRNSSFLYPAGAMRSAILSSDPSVAAVSIKRRGLTSVQIAVTDRVAVARWCGSSVVVGVESCYVFDPNGYIFATTTPLTVLQPVVASSTAASSSPATPVAYAPTVASAVTTLDPFVLYEPLASSTTDPIESTLPEATALPAVFSFAERLASFGSAVRSVSIHNGQVDDSLASGTVVKYVLGQESQALSALTAAKQDFNLADGSVQYVDLRFSGKVYVKKVQN